MIFKNSFGNINISLLTLAAVSGLILYLLITSSFPFRDKLFSTLYYKQPSHAFDSVQIPPQDAQKAITSVQESIWDQKNYTELWQEINFNCAKSFSNNQLELICKNGLLITKDKWSKDSSIIISGSFSTKTGNQSPNSIGVGLFDLSNKAPYFGLLVQPLGQLSSGDFVLDNYQLGTTQTFRLVYTKIQSEQFVYYYLGDETQPIKKIPVQLNQDPAVFLSCSGDCTFSPLTISGLITN